MSDPSTPSGHWSDISADPMDPRLISRRQAEVATARRPPVADRVSYLCELARDKRVLDVGVVDHTSSSERAERWLHGRLVEAASEILGLDIVADEVELLRQRGYNVLCMDLTAGSIPAGKYDLVVAGEIIEHLGNPGGLLDAAASLLNPSGRLVLSTPNPYAIWRAAQNLRGQPYENVDHALLLSPWGIAELAARAGLRLESFRGICTPPVGWKSRAAGWAVRWRVLPFTIEATCESILYDIVPTTVARPD